MDLYVACSSLLVLV